MVQLLGLSMVKLSVFHGPVDRSAAEMKYGQDSIMAHHDFSKMRFQFSIDSIYHECDWGHLTRISHDLAMSSR